MVRSTCLKKLIVLSPLVSLDLCVAKDMGQWMLFTCK